MRLRTSQIDVLIYAVCFASGFAGLVYEVIWARMLHIVLGSTVYAVCAVISSFMAGLAIGSYVGGRYIDRKRDILLVYAGIEAGIAAVALLLPFALNLLDSFYISLYKDYSQSHATLTLIRFILSFALLVVPSSLMGATLPVLIRYLVRTKSELGTRTGGLYGINTLGATIGCAATGFILIEAIGMSRTVLLAVGINLLAAIAAFILRFSESRGVVVATDIETAKPKSKVKSTAVINENISGLHRLILWGYALAGFVSLGYEVLWTRSIGFFAGNTSYAFSTMLSTFLFGIAVGSMAVRKLSDRIKTPIMALGICEVLIGITSVIGIAIFFGAVGALDPYQFGDSAVSPLWMKFAVSVSIMIIPTLLMGAAFPLAAKIYATDLKKVGRRVGSIYSLNTVGGIIGAIVASFILVPEIGIQSGIIILAMANIGIGLLMVLNDPRVVIVRRYAAVISSAAAVLLVFLVVPMQVGVFSISGHPNKPKGRTIYYSEGVTQTVEVLQGQDGNRHLILDGGVNASTTAIGVGVRVHTLMSQLPLILHEDPRSILLVALGSGMTAGATLAFDNLEVIDCAEISNDVVRAAGFFSSWNGDIAKSERLNLYIEDGRNFVLTTPRKYDVITTGIIHPKINPGNAGFYNRDYYELCRSRLREGGIVCQWAPLYGLTVKEFKMIVRTFMDVFPNCTLWFAQPFGSKGSSNALLIGSTGELPLEYSRINRAFQTESIREDLKRSELNNPVELLDCFAMGAEALGELAGEDTPLTTDDHPLLEFGEIEMHYDDILNLISTRRETAVAYLTFNGVPEQTAMDVREMLTLYNEISNECIRADLKALEKEYNTAIAHYCNAWLKDTSRDDLLDELLEIQRRSSKPLFRALSAKKSSLASQVTVFVEDLSDDRINDPQALNRLAYFYQAAGWLDASIGVYRRAVILDSDNPDIRFNLAATYHLHGLPESALAELDIILADNPDFSAAHALAGYVHELLGDTAMAIGRYESALSVDSSNTRASQRLSVLQSIFTR